MQSIRKTKLEELWFNAFIQNSLFNSKRTQLIQAFPSFNAMNNFHRLLDLKTDQSAIYYYQSEEVNQLNETYGRFIRLLELKEETTLKRLLQLDLTSWALFKREQRKEAISSEDQFEQLFIEWLIQSGKQTETAIQYFNFRKEKGLIRRIYHAINQFYNPWNYHSGVPIYKKAGNVLENVLSFNQDIGIDFHSNAEYPNSVNNSFSQIQATEVPFFEASGLQDLDDINQKASEATVAVHAKLTALNQLPVEPADWFDEHLVCDLLDESSAKQDILSPEERQLYRSKLKYRIQKLYLINGFQLKIELMNCFTKAEYDLLSAQKVKCFPFYFDLNVQCRQKIIQRSDGSLEIYLHCDKDLPVVIAADLKQLYRL